MAKRIVVFFSVLLIFSSGVASADLTKQDAEEIRKIVKEEIQHVNTRIDGMEKSLNTRIDGVENGLNKRIDDINGRFDDLRFWLQFIFGVQVLIIGGFITQWLLMWKRIIGTEKVLEIHLAEKEEKELISLQREEIDLLKGRLARLEGASA